MIQKFEQFVNEGYAENLEATIIETLTKMRDDLNIFLENANNEYPGEYNFNIGDNIREYSRCLKNLTQAFDDFKNLCIDDWIDWEKENDYENDKNIEKLRKEITDTLDKIDDKD